MSQSKTITMRDIDFEVHYDYTEPEAETRWNPEVKEDYDITKIIHGEDDLYEWMRDEDMEELEQLLWDSESK